MRVWMAIVTAACGIGGVIGLVAVQAVIMFEHGGKMPSDYPRLIALFLLLFLPVSVAAGVALALALWVVRGLGGLRRWSRRDRRQSSS
jgi:hypothetical protein